MMKPKINPMMIMTYGNCSFPFRSNSSRPAMKPDARMVRYVNAALVDAAANRNPMTSSTKKKNSPQDSKKSNAISLLLHLCIGAVPQVLLPQHVIQQPADNRNQQRPGDRDPY